MDKDRAYIKHVLQAIGDIEEFTKDFDREKFLDQSNKLVQTAVIREFEIIGEAVGRLSGDLKAKNQDLPWRDVIGMRNKLIHDYFSVNLKVVWNTIERDLPVLKEAMKKLAT